jgi:O-antigen/teichoic acid export membrane protein
MSIFYKQILERLGETPRQAGMLFSAQIGSMIAGFLAAAAQVRWMSPGEMGRYAFCLSIVLVASLTLDFGIFPAGGRMLALVRDRDSERQGLGALVLVTGLVGLAFSVVLASIAVPIDLLFKKDVKWLLLSVAILAAMQPFQRLVEEACQGLNQIRRLSEFQFIMAVSQLSFFVALGMLNRLTAKTALLTYLLGIGIASLCTIVLLRPKFQHVRRFISETLSEVRRYGFDVYISRITGTTSVRMDNIVITYFVGFQPLGLYYSAQRLSSPIATLSRALAITRFRAFTALDRIPRRIIRWNYGAVIGCSVVLAAIGPFALRLVFPRYAEAAGLLVPFAALNLFQGLFQPYNMFLASHGRGADLRNTAIAAIAASFIFLIILTPRFGVAGAAWAGVIAMAIDYAVHIYYYRRLRRALGNGQFPLPASPAQSYVTTESEKG